MIYQDSIEISTQGFCDVINITKKVEDIVVASEIKNGLIAVFVNGSTAGVTTLEYEAGAVSDFREAIERLVPQSFNYQHNAKWGDGNGFSHIRAAILGPSLVIPLADEKMLLGTWQQVIVVDFDNRRRQRQVLIQIVGGK